MCLRFSLRDALEPRLELIHRCRKVRSVLLCIPFDHRQRLVAADALNGGQVDVGLNEVRDRGMPQRVTDYKIRIQSGRSYYPPERDVNVQRVSTLRGR